MAGDDPLAKLPSGIKLFMRNLHNLVPDKLTDTNYPAWALNVTTALSAHLLLDWVNGDAAAPPKKIKKDGIETDNPDHALWTLIDTQIRACLLAILSPSVHKHARGFTTSSSLWEALATRYNSLSEAHIFQLRDRLHTLRKGSKTMTQYLDEVASILSDLDAVNAIIPEREVINAVVRGLPADYSSFKQHVRMNEHKITLAQVSGWLGAEELNLEYEQKLTMAESSTGGPHTALYTAGGGRGQADDRRGGGGGRGRPQPPGRGGGSGSYQQQQQQAQHGRGGGRFGRGGPPRGGGGRGSQGRELPICQICDKRGHSAASCWYRYDESTSEGPSFGGSRAMHASTSTQNGNWYLDTGANTHVTPDFSRLHAPTPYTGTDSILVGNGHSLPITHTGSGQVYTPTGNFKLNHLNHVPSLTSNLLSVHLFTKDNNCNLVFTPDQFQIVDTFTNQVRYTGRCERGLYSLPSSLPQSSPSVCQAVQLSTWHRRLGHPSPAVAKNILSSLGFNFSNSVHCESCSVAKSSRLPFSLSEHMASAPFNLIHSDVWGPTSVPSFTGYRYYISFIDDYSRFSWIYPLRRKSEAYTVFVSFTNMISTQFNSKIQIFRSDNGKEYLNNAFGQFLQNLGTIHHTSCPYTPEQNGVAERKHRHLIETVVALLYDSSLPTSFWVEALAAANYLINRMPTPSSPSPYKKLHAHPPVYTHLRPFGCLVYPWLRPHTHNKLQPRSTPCVFLGYHPTIKGYKCYDPVTEKTYVSRHVRFVEDQFPYTKLASAPHSVNPLGIVPLFPPCLTHTAPVPHQPTSGPTPPHYPTTPATAASPHSPTVPTTAVTTPRPTPQPTPIPPPGFGPLPNPSPIHPPPPPPNNHPMQTRAKSGIFKPKVYHTTVPIDIEPHTYKQASQHRVWCQAMDEEFTALQEQNTWELVPLPWNRKPIGCKWVYRIKRDANGEVSRYKARLVAKGFHQKYGIDYKETFSPVVKQQTIRLVLSLALNKQWPLHQLDVSNAFLHGDLDEDIYMEQPIGYVDSSCPTHVCRLRKSLYGLKQAPRAWYDKFSSFLQGLGFRSCLHDTSLFTLHSSKGTVIVLVYVDDIVITGSSDPLIATVTAAMHREFRLKDLGPLNFFLGIEVRRTPSTIFINQAQYAAELIDRAGMTDCKTAPTPMAARPAEGPTTPFENPTLYRSLVGGLHYLANTRPDIQYAVNRASQTMHNPSTQNFLALQRILRYLKGTLQKGILFQKGDMEVSVYSDSDWASDKDDRRSTTGYMVFFGPNLISWNTHKQKTVSRSSTEAEYRAMAAGVAEAMWLRYITDELGIPPSRPRLFCDNESTICVTKNPVLHDRMKHVGSDCHFVRDEVRAGRMTPYHVPSSEQLADILTKPLPLGPFTYLCSNLPLVPDAQIAGG